MTTQPNDHTLNACLARVIGKTVVEEDVNGEKCWAEYGDNGELIDIWCPVADSNQMEEVEAWLKQKGIEFVITSANLCNLMIVELILANGVFEGKDPDKKRAFALAVAQLGEPT